MAARINKRETDMYSVRGNKWKNILLVTVAALGVGSANAKPIVRSTVSMVGADGNANRYPFPNVTTDLYDRFIEQLPRGYDYMPIPVVDVYDQPYGGTPGTNTATDISITPAQYYNAVAYMLLRYFDFTPPVAGSPSDSPWTPPADTKICEKAMSNCTDPAYMRMRPTFKGGLLDYELLLTEYTSDTFPCNMTHSNSIVGKADFGECIETLGLTGAVYFDQDPVIINALDHMFDNTHGAYATRVAEMGGALGKIEVNSVSQLQGATGFGFSFGVGYDCKDFQNCNQPGMTNEALAATMLSSRDVLANVGDNKVSYIAQWEVAVAFANLIGVDTKSVNMATKEPQFCATYGGYEICLNIVGNPAQEGEYIDTNGVNEQGAAIIKASGAPSVVTFAHPDHMPRVYRSSIASFHGFFDGTVFAPLIPYNLNYPVSHHGAIIDLYKGSGFYDSPNFGMYPDSAQDWTRDRTIFRLYELQAFATTAEGLRHASDWYGYAENQ